MQPLSIFLAAAPGLEPLLAEEAGARGFAARAVPGGVEVAGGWPEVWRANLEIRGAARVLVRVAEFRAMHPAQLDKRARKVDWRAWLRPGVPVTVEASARKSRVYHKGAIAGRVAAAIRDQIGPGTGGDPVRVLARIEDDLCTLSIDTSGAPLHRRGHKAFVGKAPMRETHAALFLRALGYDGSQAVVDPMCGSGTFVIEAAEIAGGFQAGRSRGFAFERLASFDPTAFDALRRPGTVPAPRFFGSDRDQGAVAGAARNAEAAGVAAACRFERRALSEIAPPDGPQGLVIVNPPYGARIGNRKALFSLYGAFGAVMRDRFAGWRVGLVTSDGGLAKATGLPWESPLGPVDLGGTKVRLWQCDVGS